jgi:hypothetical protein
MYTENIGLIQKFPWNRTIMTFLKNVIFLDWDVANGRVPV